MDDPAVYWLDVDPAQALTWLESNINNRNMRPRQTNAYARDMGAGQWLVTGETIKFARGGELLDGQHRLSAIVESGTTQRLLVVEGLEPTAAAVIDTGAIRSAGDALRMAGIGLRSPYALAAAARLHTLWTRGALTHYTSGNRRQDRATHQEVLTAVRERPDLVDAVDASVAAYDRIGLPAGPQAMARTVLADVDAADAERFWDSLVGYATDGPTDPRAALLFSVRQLRAVGELRRPGQAIGLTFAAWNAWRDGQKVSSLPWRDSKGKPLRIQTPV